MRRYLFMAITSALFGTIGICVKLIGNSVPPMAITFYRFFFGFIFLLCVTPFIDKNIFRVTKNDIRDYFVIGLLFSVTLPLFTLANVYAPVQNVVLLDSTTPFFVLGIAYVFLKEKITRTKTVAFAIAMAGIVIINPLQSGQYQLGNTLAILAAATYGVLVVEMRKEDENHGIGDVMWFLLFATLLSSPIPFIYGLGDLSAAWPYLFFMGFLGTGLAYLLYNISLERIEAEISTIMTMIISPIVAISLAFFILGEKLEINTMAGGAILIISAIYLQLHKRELGERSSGHHPMRGHRQKCMKSCRK
jgi:drug/metabolite transporter (DMT)-like permease